MPAPTDTLLPPRYGNVRPIAHGGMGEIFLATDRELGREVAVKVLAERFAKDESLRERFKREALAAARLSGNPNIVTIFDVGEHGGRPIIVMEHLSGGSLAQRVSGRKPCPAAQVLDWLGEAAAALDAAHAAGIVHRDVKPGNLLLDDRGHVKVADFGIASAAGLDSFTQTGTILGTAGYLSPEQARGERATAASDLYALAVVAWELLAGRRPFEAQPATAEALAHVNAPVPSVHEANPDLPAAFDDVFERALAKDPRARYATAADFVGDLRSTLHHSAGDTWIEPAATTRVVARPRTGPSRWWIPVLLVALLAGGALAAFLVSRASDSPAASGVRTVVHTVTGPGETVRETVTTAAATTTPATTTPATTAPATTTPTTTAATTAPSGSSGTQLNAAGFAKMQAGDYGGALPLLEQAVQKLNGSGQVDEAYADYNLAYTRRRLGSCDGVLDLLDRSQAIQGHRSEINKLRAEARHACA